LAVFDHRQGSEFDGPWGNSPGWAPGDPTDYVGVVIIDDEASAWLDRQRPK
jgi:hypothetical protein